MAIITVKAAPGVRVPYEDNARKYITEGEAVSVLESTYYLRRLADKDLVPCQAESVADKTAPTPADPAPAPGKTSPETDQVNAPAKAAADPTTADQVAPAEGARARTTKNKGA